MTNNNVQRQLEASSQFLGNLVDSVFESLEMLRDIAVPILNKSNVSREHLKGLQEPVETIIEKHQGLVSGAGIAIAPGALAQTDIWMQAWHKKSDAITLTTHSLNPASINYYDYTDMDWFKVPTETGEPFITAPYVDFGGTDQLIITAGIPASCRNQTVSAVVADVNISVLEKRFLSVVLDESSSYSLITEHGKVIATNSARNAVTKQVTLSDQIYVNLESSKVATGWKIVSTEN